MEREYAANIVGVDLLRGFYLQLAVIQDDIAPLVETLSANRKFDWISRRIQRLWGDWVEAIHRLQREKPFTHAPKTVRAANSLGQDARVLRRRKWQLPKSLRMLAMSLSRALSSPWIGACPHWCSDRQSRVQIC